MVVLLLLLLVLLLGVHKAEVTPHEKLDQIGGAQQSVAVVSCYGTRECLTVVVQGLVLQDVFGTLVLGPARAEVVQVGGRQGEHSVHEVDVLLRLLGKVR